MSRRLGTTDTSTAQRVLAGASAGAAFSAIAFGGACIAWRLIVRSTEASVRRALAERTERQLSIHGAGPDLIGFLLWDARLAGDALHRDAVARVLACGQEVHGEEHCGVCMPVGSDSFQLTVHTLRSSVFEALARYKHGEALLGQLGLGEEDRRALHLAVFHPGRSWHGSTPQVLRTRAQELRAAMAAHVQLSDEMISIAARTGAERDEEPIVLQVMRCPRHGVPWLRIEGATCGCDAHDMPEAASNYTDMSVPIAHRVAAAIPVHYRIT